MLRSVAIRFHCRHLVRPARVRFYHELSFESHGDPNSVLEFQSLNDSSDDVSPPETDSTDALVRVEMWHAPWNPADANTVQGKYPSPYSTADPQRDAIRKSRFIDGRTVAGSEGWGIVTNLSGEPSTLNVGDIVTVGAPGLGTYRSSLWVPSRSLTPLKRGMDLKSALGASASTLPQLGGTALRMLNDFVSLTPGEVVLQNAGNSAVGFVASQLGETLKKVRVVSLVRRGRRTPVHWDELVNHLTQKGMCTKVVAEEDLTGKGALKEFQSQLRDLSATHKLPILGLNAVGGESASVLLRCLEQAATMVTYGGMSQHPVTSSTSQFIFKDLRLRGYWHSRWMVQSSHIERRELMDELSEAVLSGGVTCPPVEEFPLAKFQDGLICDSSQSGVSIRRKVVFRFQ